MVARTKTSFAFGVTTLAVLTLCSAARADRSPHEWAFIRLDYACKEKARQFKRFCDQVHERVTRARTDDVLVEFFDVNRKYFHLHREGNRPPEELTTRIGDLHRAMNDHYVRNYLCFYDILMIDTDGNVFYTIRKESDYQHTLFEGALARTPLVRCLRADPQEEVFVDFQYYAASDKPAAFFVEPVSKDGQHLGWLVLQCAINKVNSLFAGAEKLGETGETFLVNHDGYLLTESNFEGDSTILKKRLDDRNIKIKFHEKQGHRTVTDYRGFPALTSFEVVEFLGTQWLVVAKVDEAQIIAEHFQLHQEYYHDRIIRHLTNLPVPDSTGPVPISGKKTIQVDMDEFVGANHDELLRTVGVSTCTAVVATYPGKFGYLAHISPLDKIYGGNATNPLGHIIKKIKTYDIYKYERPRVRFVVVAGHCDSLPQIVGKLVDERFLLSQITVLHGPPGHYANVTYGYSQDRISVKWVSDQTGVDWAVQQACDAQNLGESIRQLIAGANGDLETQGPCGLTQVSRDR